MQISSLVVKIGANITELQAGLSKASQSIEKVGKNMEQMGKTLSTRVTAPLTALGAVAVRAFGIQEKAEFKLRAALQANGREVDKLFGRYTEFASEMQRLTIVGDETTLSMLQQAESIGLTGDAAERAVKNAISLAASSTMNAESALRYTAALEEGNATMLTRYIPALRDIKDESEKVAFAQDNLAKRFDVARAEALTTTGQINQMKNAVGDLMESFGEIISKAIMPMVNRIKELAERFQGLDSVTKEQIVVFGGLAAAAGPVLLGLGKITTAVILLNRHMMKNPYHALAVAILAISTHVFMANRRLSRMNDLVQEALDMSPTGTRDEIDKLNEAIVFQEKLIEKITDQHKTMGIVGSESSERQLAPMREILNELIGIRDQSAGLQLQGIIDGKEIEKAENLSVAVSGLRHEIERFKDAIKPEDQDIFGDEELQIREARNEFNKFENGLFEFLNTDFSDPIVKLGEETEKMTNSFSEFAGIAVQAFDRLVFSGQKFGDILKSIARQLASKALLVGLQAMMGGGGLSAIGGLGGLFKSVIGVNDALITSGGDVVKFHKNDNILAMKDFSGIGGGGGSQRVEVYGTIKGQDLFISSQRGSTSFNR